MGTRYGTTPTHKRSGIDEIVLAQLGKFPRRAEDIFRDARNEYGTITDRTLWRTLGRLERRGLVEHIGPKHSGQWQLAS